VNFIGGKIATDSLIFFVFAVAGMTLRGLGASGLKIDVPYYLVIVITALMSNL